MPTCPSCFCEVRDVAASRCPTCGASVPGDPTTTVNGVTVLSQVPLREAFEADRRVSQFDPLNDARFAPGQVFASRYRIVNLLGRGSMGEVYRADDLKLGQRVALKLCSLGPAYSEICERIAGEVRLAREVSHPNVCRVYDIGEAEGWHYLSMEYVDGETLASLLRRIGRLPTEKALDVARQICAALSAAHDRGILLRDLKPSNIMVDASGQVRVVDMGLAIRIGDPIQEVCGTPGYMAPEQLAGGPTTVQTDLFAVGVVLYELFTGRRLFPIRTLEERLGLGDLGPGETTREIDPAIDELIRRCIERDPHNRPVSALAIAAALPGGDSLAAALAEGRLPSPDMVAAAGQKGALRPALAWTLFLAIIGGTLAVASRVDTLTYLQPSVLPKPPDALAERARNVVAALGHVEMADNEFWFEPSSTGAEPQELTRTALIGANPFPVQFVYRQSPQYLVTQNSMHLVSETDPPADLPGIATVVLAPGGRLLRMNLIPFEGSLGSFPRPTIGWPDLFKEAELDWKEFAPVESVSTPLLPHDSTVAWESGSSSKNGRLRVVGASLNGRPVHFEVTHAGALPAVRSMWFSRTGRSTSGEALIIVGSVAIFLGGGILTRRNLRLGYGDIRAARRISVFAVSAGLVGSVLRAHHAPVVTEEWVFLLIASGWNLVWGAFVWLAYISLEPFVRRWWPHTLISWTRLVSGRWRDPLVGRDVLAGLLAGIVLVTVKIVQYAATRQAGVFLSPTDQRALLESLGSARHLFGGGVFALLEAMIYALSGLVVLVLNRVVVRNSWIAAAILVAGLTALGLNAFRWDSVFPLAIAVLTVAVLLRLGLLSMAVTLLFLEVMTRLPITLHLNAWYYGSSLVSLLAIGGLATYGFIVSLAGRPAFGEERTPLPRAR